MARLRVSSFLIICLLAGACTWVKPTSEGQKVKVVTANEASACKKLGTTEVSLLAKVAGVNRSKKKVQQELQTLARNSGAKMGGDSVVASSEINEGKQNFDVYLCGHP